MTIKYYGVLKMIKRHRHSTGKNCGKLNFESDICIRSEDDDDLRYYGKRRVVVIERSKAAGRICKSD